MFRGALSTPMRTDDAAGVLVIGTVLTLCSWILVPLWIVASLLAPFLVVLAPVALAPALVTRGYFLSVLREAAADGNAVGAPSFVSWGALYRDGIRSALVSLWYLLPLAGLLALAAATGALVELERIDPDRLVEPVAAATFVGDAPVGEEAAVDALVGVLGGVAGILAVGYLVAFVYVRPAALAVLAETGRLRDAIRPGRPLRIALSGDYAAAWILALATVLLGYALAAPFVPLIVGIGLVFTVRIVVHALHGRGAAAALAASRPETVRVGDPSIAPGDHGDESAEAVTGRSDASATEASPAVQTGRGVGLLGVTSGAADGDPDDLGDVTGDDFDADVGGVTGDDSGGGDDARVVADRDEGDEIDPTDESRFEWGSPIERR